MRVGDAVGMPALVDHALAADLQERDAGRGVEIGVAPAHQPPVADLRNQPVEPIIVAEPDADQNVGAAYLI